jgi:hypothetical protein
MLRVQPGEERCAQYFAKEYRNEDKTKCRSLLVRCMWKQQQQKNYQDGDDRIGPE